MSVGYFVDKDDPPSEKALLEALGLQYPLWEQLQQFIYETYQMTGEMSFGGNKYGWNLWYRKSGKSLISLYPQKEYLVAQVVLGKEQFERALQLDLGNNVDRMLRETPQLHDGCWLFIQVHTSQDAGDVEQLLQVKKRPVQRKSSVT